MGHSTLGPSQAKRWINCPGSVALCSKAPPQAPNYNAAEGTIAHEIAEQYVTGKIDSLEMMALIGTTRKQEGFDVEIIEEMFDGAVEYKELIEELRGEMFHMKPGVTIDDIIEHCEKRVHAVSVDDRVWGTTDWVMWMVGKKLIVLDYKFGQGVIVDPEENEQGALYLLGVLDSLVDSATSFEDLEIIIHQPRGRHVDGPVRRWVVPQEWLAEFRARAKAAAAKTLEPNAPLKAGDWCRWCSAKPFCPEVHKGAQEAAMVAFDVPAPMTPQKAIDKIEEIRLLPVEKIVAMLKWEPAVKALMEAAKDVIRERLTNGISVPGVKLVDGREGNREWISEQEVVAEFAPTLGEAALYEKKLLSPAKIEKIVGKKHKIDHLVTRKPGEKAIAWDNDPRPAAATAAQDAFKVVETTAVKVAGCDICDALGASECETHRSPAALPDLMAELNGGGKKREPLWPQ